MNVYEDNNNSQEEKEESKEYSETKLIMGKTRLRRD